MTILSEFYSVFDNAMVLKFLSIRAIRSSVRPSLCLCLSLSGKLLRSQVFRDLKIISSHFPFVERYLGVWE